VQEFIYFINPTRDDFLDTITDAEKAIVSEHFEYLKDRLAEGKLVLAGRCADVALGIAVFYADSPEDAQSFMENDPFISSGLAKGDLHPYGIALLKE
jgi:uncharacterized protein